MEYLYVESEKIESVIEDKMKEERYITKRGADNYVLLISNFELEYRLYQIINCLSPNLFYFHKHFFTQVLGYNIFVLDQEQDDINVIKSLVLAFIQNNEFWRLYNRDQQAWINSNMSYLTDREYTERSTYIASHRNVHVSEEGCTITLNGQNICRGETEVDSISFDEWYENITYMDFKKLWDKTSTRELIASIRRWPYGNHEWLMVSETLTAKYWGIPAWLLNHLVTPTTHLKFKCGGCHGGRNSGRFHLELRATIQQATNRVDLLYKLKSFIEDWVADETEKKQLISYLAPYLEKK